MFITKYVIADSDLDDMGLKRINPKHSVYNGWLGNSIEELRYSVLNRKPAEVSCTCIYNINNDRKYIIKAEYYDIDYDDTIYKYFYPKERAY